MSKKNKKAQANAGQMSAEAYIKSGRVRKLPIDKCFISEGWQETGLASIFITRKHVNGNVTSGVYMADIYCAGIKDAHYTFNEDPDRLLEYFEESKNFGQTFIECEYVLAHNIIYSALEFADEFGIKPHKDFEVAKYILEEDTDDIELMEIECGKDGKPFLVATNPNDPRNSYYLSQLRKNAGEGNYEYEQSFGDSHNEWDDYEFDDDDEDDVSK